MLLVIVKANLYGDNSFTTNGNFLVSNYGVKYNLLLTVNNIEILFKFKCGTDEIQSLAFQNVLANSMRKKNGVREVEKILEMDFDSNAGRQMMIKALIRAVEYT